jgi:hypothetical protein
VTVELVHAGEVKLSYSMMVESDDGDHIVVEGPYSEPQARDLGYVVLELGDRFREHYWRTRWYSIKEIRDDSGAGKGWYCDVARPVAVSASLLQSVDLDLDVWASADGATVLALDDDEFVESGIEQWDPSAAGCAREALSILLDAARDGFRALVI